jgi:FkbM family methyltransferase
MDPDLIFDVGMHQGIDTAYYLHLGYRVVAIDADQRCVDTAAMQFGAARQDGRLVLVHCAVTDRDGSATLYLSERSLWNSLNRDVANRRGFGRDSVSVPARRLAGLFEQYGVPYYCKIDIEGEDAACLKSLSSARELPRFISVETECVGAHDVVTDDTALETLRGLKALGYDRFKLVSQIALAVLPASSIHDNQAARWPTMSEAQRRRSANHQYAFQLGSSGPFGERLEGEWLDYDLAGQVLLDYRRAYLRAPDAVSYGFWCDWHATRRLP